MEKDADSWSIASPETGGFRLYHPAAMARTRCLRRVPLRGAGTCLDAADDRRNSRRARNCSGEAGMVASVLFLVAMAGSLLVMRAGGLFIRNEQRHVVHWSVGSELPEGYEHLGDVCVQVRELAGDWSVANPELVGAKTAASGIGNLDEGVVRPGIKRRPRSMWATILITAEDAILFLLVTQLH